MNSRTLTTALVVLALLGAVALPAMAAQLQASQSQADPLTAQQTTAEILVDGNLSAGETVAIAATVNGEPMAGADVVVNDRHVGEIDANGTLTGVTVPDAEAIEIDVESDDRKLELDLEDAALDRAATAERTTATMTVDGTLSAGKTVNVSASIFGEGLADAVVEVDSDEMARTGADGSATATVPDDEDFEVEFETADAELGLELEDAVGPPADDTPQQSEKAGDGPFRIVVLGPDGQEILNRTVAPGEAFELEVESEDGETRVEFESGEEESEFESGTETETEDEIEDEDETETEDQIEDEDETETEDETEDDDSSGSGS